MSRRRRLRFQNRVFLWVLLAATPAWLTAVGLLWSWNANPVLRSILVGVVSVLGVAGAFVVRRRVVSPLRSLASMVEAVREGDYSLRGRNEDPQDAIGAVTMEVNSLSRTLYHQRLAALEASVLLNKVVAEVDIAVFAFDADHRLCLANRAGEALLGGTAAKLQGRSAAEIGLAALLDTPVGQIVSHVFPGGAGRWEIRRRSFRQGGRPHELLVISDVSRALREEERQAWQRIVRVIGHELNSSLAPIKSIAGTLRRLLERDPLPEDWRDDAHSGLTIVHDRAESLGRFMGAYARLARLPAPVRRPVDFGQLVRRAAALHGKHVAVEAGPDLSINVDADQIEQVLINLIKNAVEAAGAAVDASEGESVRVRWHAANGRLHAEVEDDGIGLAHTENIWIPFFSTKPEGTGIGLVLSRAIVENHSGSIALENRINARGCIARVDLPLEPL